MRSHVLFCLLLSVVASSWLVVAGCRSPEPPSADVPTVVESPAVRPDEPRPPAEPWPLGPEMAQLERDLATNDYHETILGWTNYNDLNGEMNRADLPDCAARFEAAHGGAAAIEADPAKKAALDRRRKIEADFLALMKKAYKVLEREKMFDGQLARLRREAAVGAVGATALPAAKPIEPILPAVDAGAYWPRWRGPSGQGHSEETGLPLEWDAETGVVWKTPIPGRGHSSPVIWGDRIWLITAFDKGARRSLIAVRRSDGELLWTRDAPEIAPEKKTMAKNSWASSTPVVDEERVVAFLGNTGLVAFSHDGDRLWHYPMPWFDGTHGTGASPAICGDAVVLFQEHSRGKSIAVGIDKNDGHELWKTERDAAYGWCTVLPLRIGGRDELVVGVHHRILGVDPGNGAELWSCSGPTREVVPTLVYGHGLVYTCSGRNGPTIAIRPGGDDDVTATHIAWQSGRGAPHVPSPILVDDLLYFTNDNGIVTCLDATTGETVYQSRLRGKFTASPVAADGKIYFTNERGVTFVVKPGRDFEILARNSLGETTLASMAVLGGRLFIRTEKHLWAIGT